MMPDSKALCSSCLTVHPFAGSGSVAFSVAPAEATSALAPFPVLDKLFSYMRYLRGMSDTRLLVNVQTSKKKEHNIFYAVSVPGN